MLEFVSTWQVRTIPFQYSSFWIKGMRARLKTKEDAPESKWNDIYSKVIIWHIHNIISKWQSLLNAWQMFLSPRVLDPNAKGKGGCRAQHGFGWAWGHRGGYVAGARGMGREVGLCRAWGAHFCFEPQSRYRYLSIEVCQRRLRRRVSINVCIRVRPLPDVCPNPIQPPTRSFNTCSQ